MSNEITDTDLALIELASAAIVSLSVGDTARQQGLNELLAHVRDTFLEKGNKKAAAITETVRSKSTDPNGAAASINAFMERIANPGASH